MKLDKELEWKNNRNKDQYCNNADIQEPIEQTIWSIKCRKGEQSIELLEKGLSTVQGRQKLIKSADSS